MAALTLTLSLGCAATPPADTPDSAPPAESVDHQAELNALLEDAAEAWAERMEADQLQRAIEAWESAKDLAMAQDLLDDQALSDLHLRLAQAYAFAARARGLGVHAVPPSVEEAAAKGVSSAEAALKLTPDSSAARYWLAATIDQGARAEGVAATLEQAPRLHALLDAIAANPPSSMRAETHLMLAMRACASDFGRDLDACAEHLDAADELSPELLEVDLARAALLDVAQNDRTSFEARLERLSDTSVEDLSPENRLSVMQAGFVIDLADRYFGPASP